LKPIPMAPCAERAAAFQELGAERAAAASQMTSLSMTGLLQQKEANEPAASTGALTLTRRGWSARRFIEDPNISLGVHRLIKGDDDATAGSSADFASPRGPVLGPRHDASSPGGTPWAMDENGEQACPAVACSKQSCAANRGGKLAEVARSCLQQTELRIESEQLLNFRPQTRAGSKSRIPNFSSAKKVVVNGPGFSYPDSLDFAKVMANTTLPPRCTPGKNSSRATLPSSRGGGKDRTLGPPLGVGPPKRSTLGGRVESSFSAALVKFAAEVSKSIPTQPQPRQEVDSKVQH